MSSFRRRPLLRTRKGSDILFQMQRIFEITDVINILSSDGSRTYAKFFDIIIIK